MKIIFDILQIQNNLSIWSNLINIVRPCNAAVPNLSGLMALHRGEASACAHARTAPFVQAQAPTAHISGAVYVSASTLRTHK